MISCIEDKIICILQPGYIPWLGFFDQMLKADLFVIYDDVQYDKSGWRNRNRIKTSTGPLWLTVPVSIKNNYHTLIKDIRIANSTWTKKHVKSLKQNYSKAKYLDQYYDGLCSILYKKHTFLLDLDMEIIRWVAALLNINTKIVFSSTLGIEGKKSVRMLNIVKALKGTTLLEGDKGQEFIDTNHFVEKGIKIVFHNYDHPIYSQLYGAFISNLSIIDLIFNCGEDSLKILNGERSFKNKL